MSDHSRIPALDTVGIIAVNSPDYLRHMISGLVSDRVFVPLRSCDDQERLVHTSTKDVITPESGSGWIDDKFTSSGGKRPAQISFSSGTEGPPKAVLLSQTNLDDAVGRVSAALQIQEDIREYVAVPVYHSFGYARARIALNAGGAVYVPEKGLDIPLIRRMLSAGEVNALSAVPSQWRVILQNLDLFGGTLEKLRWVEIGSQFMSGEEKRALRKALPGARIVQHYGLTEASRTSLLRIHEEDQSRLGSVGRAEGNVKIRIGEDGRIETRGPHVALGIDDGESWHEYGPNDWLKTSDRGRMDDGYLWFEGRADDVINCAGIKLSPDLMEAHIRSAHPDAGDFAILRRPDPLRGEGIQIALGPGTEETLIVEAAEDYAKSNGLEAAGAIHTTHVESLPRTDTGKIQRQKLADELDRETQPKTSQGGDLATQLQEILGCVDMETSFHQSGGDSLRHLQVSLALERAIGTTPENWESLPLTQLVEMAETSGAEHLKPAAGAPPLPKGDRNLNPSEVSFWALIKEDFQTNDASLTHQGFLMLLVHRFGNWRMDVKSRLLRIPLTLVYRVLNKLTQILFGMKLDYTVELGRRVKLEHFGGMILGARRIGNDVILRQNTTIGIRSTDDLNAKPTIGDFVDIGAGAVIVGDISIGENSVIGANSVVYMNVPPNSVVVGVPGKVIGPNPRQNPSPLVVGRFKS